MRSIIGFFIILAALSFSCGCSDLNSGFTDSATTYEIPDLTGHYFITPDSKTIIIQRNHDTPRVAFVNTSDGSIKKEFPLEGKRPALVGVSPDWRYLLCRKDTNENYNAIDFISIEDGRILKTLFASPFDLTGVTYSHDGRVFASCQVRGSGYPDVRITIKIWSAVTGELIREIYDNHWPAGTIKISPNGKIVAVAGGAGIRFWSVETGKVIATVNTNERISESAFSNDGKLLAAMSSDHQLGLISLDDYSVRILQYRYNNHWHYILPACLSFSPDSSLLASGDQRGVITLWDVENGNAVGWVWTSNKTMTSKPEFTPDGEKLITISYDEVITYDPSGAGTFLNIWSLNDDFTENPYRDYQDSHFERVQTNDPYAEWTVERHEDRSFLAIGVKDAFLHLRDLYFSKDGKRLITRGQNTEILNLYTLEYDVELELPPNESHVSLRQIDISPDGKSLMGTNGTKLYIWSMDNGDLITTSSNMDYYKIFHFSTSDVDFSPDGSNIVIGNEREYIAVASIRTGKRVRRIPKYFRDYAFTSYIYRIALSPDSRYIAALGKDSEQRLLKIFSYHTGPLIKTLQADYKNFDQIFFSDDSRTVTLIGPDKRIKTWSINTGELTIDIEGDGKESGKISLSPSNRLAAVMEYDKPERGFRLKSAKPTEIEIISTSTAEVIQAIKVYLDTAICMAISQDERVLAVGDKDGTIKLFTIDPDYQHPLVLHHKKEPIDIDSFNPDESFNGYDYDGTTHV